MKTCLDSYTESFNQDYKCLKPKFLPMVAFLALGFSANSLMANNNPPPPRTTCRFTR